MEKLFAQAVSQLFDKQDKGIDEELEVLLDVIYETFYSTLFEDIAVESKVRWLMKLVSAIYLQYLNDILEKVGKEKELSEENLRRGIVAAQENERRRITIMLHDDVIQSLAGVLLQVQMVSQMIKEGLNNGLMDVRKLLVELEETVRNTIKSCRLTTRDGDTFLLEKAGFIPAVESYILGFKNKNGIKVILDFKDADLIKAQMNIHLFYIIREALTNIKKYAEASLISVMIGKVENELVLNVKDNGKGFLWDENNSFISEVSLVNHFGLFCIEQRTKILRGKLTINTAPGYGTELIVKVPIDELELDKPIVKSRRGSPWIRSGY
ncbi:sensor histidine kinase [Desulfoscipio gibsoniae]|nr:ATP-binding protein [Desulfoscipio gibsoniae]